jgi:predicted SAM-dependent methyltransferase
MIRLNVGCNEYAAEGWTNIDRYEHEGVDLVADLTVSWPWTDGSVQAIYAGHVLEHLTYDDELPAFLSEARRVLVPLGIMMVVGPDVERARRRFPYEVPAIWPGAKIPDMPGAEHQWEPTLRAHVDAIEAAGFEAEEIPITEVPDDWPVVSRIGWQLALICLLPSDF